MNKPDNLEQLITELTNETDTRNSSVHVDSDSKAVVYVNEKAASSGDGIELSSFECQLLLGSSKTVTQMHEALGSPREASIELHSLELGHEALDTLEKRFIAVDEQ